MLTSSSEHVASTRSRGPWEHEVARADGNAERPTAEVRRAPLAHNSSPCSQGNPMTEGRSSVGSTHASCRPRRKHDNHHPEDAHERAEYVPGGRPHAIDYPKPEDGGSNVNTPVRGVDAPCGRGLKCEQPGENRQAERRW